MLARRPPNRMMSSGTASSQSSEICGHCAAATVKREFGCAAGRPESGRPVLALPVDEVRRRRVGQALPPHVAVGTERDVGEDRVAPEGLDRGDVGRFAGAGCDAEEAGLRVDGPHAAVFAGADPCDVVAERLDLPTGDVRAEHREVRLAAGRGERGGHVVRLAVRVDDADEQHVLGQPALVAGDHRGDAQREALLGEDRVAAVARAVGVHLERVGEVHDVLVVVAGPLDILLTRGERGTDGVHRLDPRGALGDLAGDGVADPGHDADGCHGVGAVGDLHTDVREWAAHRAHRERHDVHRATSHRALEDLGHLRVHLGRVGPVVRRAGILLLLGGDEGARLGACDVAGVRARQVRAGAPLGVELDELALVDETAQQSVVLGRRAVDPVHSAGWVSSRISSTQALSSAISAVSYVGAAPSERTGATARTTRCEGLDHSHDCSLRIEEIGVCIHSEQPTRALSVNFILKKYVSFGMLKE